MGGSDEVEPGALIPGFETRESKIENLNSELEIRNQKPRTSRQKTRLETFILPALNPEPETNPPGVDPGGRRRGGRAESRDAKGSYTLNPQP